MFQNLLRVLFLTGAVLPAAGPFGLADEEKGLIGHWIFSPMHRNGGKIKDLAAARGAQDAGVSGAFVFSEDPAALRLDGRSTNITIHRGTKPDWMPRLAVTAEAWIAVDAPVEWGGILGFLQDNGGFEKGWLLGTRNAHFTFALSSAGADDGDGILTYLSSKTEFRAGRWYHVAGTYNGSVLRIYVNGELENETTAQYGEILYPDRSFFEIAAYRDDNEYFRFDGMLHEVRLYDRALRPAEVLAHYQAKQKFFPEPLEFEEGPVIRPVRTDAVSLVFRCGMSGSCVVEYGEGTPLKARVSSRAIEKEHQVVLTGIRPDRSYYYRILWTGADGSRRTSPLFAFDAMPESGPGPFPDRPPPYPEDAWTPVYAEAADWIAKRSGVRKGYCLVLGCREGRLAYELARRTDLTIVGIEPDRERAAAARAALDKAGIYGTRVSVHEGALSDLPFPDYFANLIVSDLALTAGELPGTFSEMYRVLRPCGGCAIIGRMPGSGAPAALDRARLEAWIEGAPSAERKLVEDNGLWAVIRREVLPEAGEWTHSLADPANTACSGDRRAHGKLMLQWFGRPGPRLMIDRHHRNVPPLYKDGRLFVPADDRVIALDAYNGAWLWDVAVPRSRRLGVFLDSSNLVVDEQALYIAYLDRCAAFDTATGRPGRVYEMPRPIRGEELHWSFLARADDLLFGSGRLPGASYTETSHAADAALWYDSMAIVTSRCLFALDRGTGKLKWKYASGVIINPTITIGGRRVYFLETHSPKALADTTGRMPGAVFLEGDRNVLTALDMETGRTLYRRPVDLGKCRLIQYLNYKDEVLLLSGGEYEGGKLWYSFHAMDAGTGNLKWQQRHDTGFDPGGGHGEQNRHPTLVGDVVYTYPYAYRLMTGERIEEYCFDRSGHGCGGVSASAHALFWRGGNPAMSDLLEGGRVSKINHVSRPGCWINIIPAGGMVLIPEASSGCTCDFPLQTSMAYRPEN